MSSLSLLKKYGNDVSPQILSQYKKPDKYLWVNENDRDLTPMRINLPEPPEYHLIEGFGLSAREQKWKPPELPTRLNELQRKFETIDEIWDELDTNKHLYEEEIIFIKKQWFYRLSGYWFFINGKPTFIDGWHYFYCGWWNIDIGLPEYRDRDRKFFIYARALYNETSTFKETDKDGYAILNDNGYYDMVDMNMRLFLGFLYPKHRREGATYKAECISYEIISRTLNAKAGIQSLTDDQAQECFQIHLVAPWKKLPFFFKPNYEGSTSPKNELSFSPPAKRLSSKGSLSISEIGLESKMTYGKAEPSAYDSWKLYFHHDDEIAKLEKGMSCIKRHQVVAQCLQQGAGKNIIGFTIKTSTVGEFEKGGGREFKKLCSMSDYFQRNRNGRTRSGLAILFIPADEGFEGFIDECGNSVTDTPTPQQAAYIGSTIGAREYILNERKALLDAGNHEELNEFIRLYPIKFTECFRTATKASGFNMQKLEMYIDNLRLKKGADMPVQGDFEWVDGVEDGKVEFIPSKNGKFFVSVLLNPNEANRKYWSHEFESWVPNNITWGCAGGDPFKFNKVKTNRKSAGGGGVVRKAKIKENDLSLKRKVACTYQYRAYDKKIYGEDMIKMTVYYGVKMFPEIDYPFLWDYYNDRGYNEFLLYPVDPKTGQESKTPGEHSKDKIKQAIFTEYMEFIENEADEENHIEVLEDCRDIDGVEDMTNYDRFTAVGYALLATNGIYSKLEEVKNPEVPLERFVKKRVYKK